MTGAGQHRDGAGRAPTHLTGPASKAPEVGQSEDVGESPEQSDADKEPEEGDSDQVRGRSATTTVAVDPVRSVEPVRMMQALQARILWVEQQASQILRNDATALVADERGGLQPVNNENGWHNVR